MTQNQTLNLNELHRAYLEDPLLVDSFASSLRDFIIKIVKSECRRHSASTFDTIEDAVGDSLLEAWQALGTFNSEKSQFTTWVTTIVLRNITDIYRKYKKRQEIELDDTRPYLGLSDGGFLRRIAGRDLLGHLDNDDKLFVIKKLEGLSESELDAYFGRKVGWANDTWRNLKVKLRFLVVSSEQ